MPLYCTTLFSPSPTSSNNSYTLAFDGTNCKICSTASSKLIPGAHIKDILHILNAIPWAHHTQIHATYLCLGGSTLATKIKNAPDAAHTAYTTSNSLSILPHQQPVPVLCMAKTDVVYSMKPTDIKELHALYAPSHANKQCCDPKTKKLDLSNNQVIHAIYKLHSLAFNSNGSAIQSMVSGIPIFYVHVEDHLYILNAEPSIHHAHIRAEYPHLNKLDKESHQLNPEQIECTLFNPASIQLAFTFVHNLTNCIYKSHNTVTMFGKDFISTLEQIHHRLNPYILLDSMISMPSSMPSVKALHITKEPLKTTIQEDSTPLEPGYCITSTKETTYISLSQAALSLTSSQHSTQPCKKSIFDYNPHLKTNPHSCRTLPDSLGNIPVRSTSIFDNLLSNCHSFLVNSRRTPLTNLLQASTTLASSFNILLNCHMVLDGQASFRDKF
jgi:hypothetical protein